MDLDHLVLPPRCPSFSNPYASPNNSPLTCSPALDGISMTTNLWDQPPRPQFWCPWQLNASCWHSRQLRPMSTGVRYQPLILVCITHSCRPIVPLSWDADRYADMLGSRLTGQSETLEAALDKRYPIDLNNKDRHINIPCVVTDRNGKVLFWYLPDALMPERKVCGIVVIPVISRLTPVVQEATWQSLLNLEQYFKGSVGGPNSTWRVNAGNFKDPAECKPVPGNINLSPAWFQQGHEVCSAILISSPNSIDFLSFP
jgi:hypothetical protein